MAHMIEDNQISYNLSNGVPWHGLGTAVPAGTSGVEMLKLAGLDFLVESMEINLSHLPNKSDYLSKWKAIGRRDTNKVFSIQSGRYQIHQNAQIADVFQAYCDAGHAEMDIVGALRGGAVVWALAKLNGRTKLTLAGNDCTEGYLLMVSSHDGTLPTSCHFTQKRAVCNNTLFPAIKSGRMGFRMKHSKEWTSEVTEQIQSDMGIAIERIQEFNELSDRLSHVTIDRKGQIEFISSLLDGKCLIDTVIDNTTTGAIAHTSNGSLLDAIVDAKPHADFSSDDSKLNRVEKSILDCILNSPGSELESANGTLWGALNGVSYYTDHVASRTADTRLYNAYFGPSVDLKLSAVNVARDMAGIN